jgi:hypothetical protein
VTTFVEMTDLMPNANPMASRVLRWTIENLQHPAGLSYLQRHRFHTIKIPYMRWALQWMLYARQLLSLCLEDSGKQQCLNMQPQ